MQSMWKEIKMERLNNKQLVEPHQNVALFGADLCRDEATNRLEVSDQLASAFELIVEDLFYRRPLCSIQEVLLSSPVRKNYRPNSRVVCAKHQATKYSPRQWVS